MVSADAILRNLSSAANTYQVAALIWHVQIAAVALKLVLARERPSRQLAAIVLMLPLISVSVLASHHGDLFNGAAFLVLTGSLAVCARGMSGEIVSPRSSLAWVVGMGSVLMALVYPHFVGVRSPLLYLVVAPVGVLPCPTLNLVVGATLLGGGLGSRGWSITLALVAIFYALFGVAFLSVWIDLVLLGAAGTLLVLSLRANDAQASARGQGRRRDGARREMAR